MNEVVSRWVAGLPARYDIGPNILDIGGMDVNGSVRGLFPGCTYTAVDRRPGEGVDIVADALTWRPDHPADTVLSLSVLEHLPEADHLVAAMAQMVGPMGVVAIQTVGDPWPEHGEDGGPVGDEFYRNVRLEGLVHWVQDAGLVVVESKQLSPAGEIVAVGIRVDG